MPSCLTSAVVIILSFAPESSSTATSSCGSLHFRVVVSGACLMEDLEKSKMFTSNFWPTGKCYVLSRNQRYAGHSKVRCVRQCWCFSGDNWVQSTCMDSGSEELGDGSAAASDLQGENWGWLASLSASVLVWYWYEWLGWWLSPIWQVIHRLLAYPLDFWKVHLKKASSIFH